MQDADSMELVDRKITAATILGVHVTEVYSLQRVAKVARRYMYGVVADVSMDLSTGCDFTKESDRQLTWRRVRIIRITNYQFLQRMLSILQVKSCIIL